MANPTEITNTITNFVEITNTVISVLDKIDIVDITQPIVWYKNFTFWGMLATVFGAVATVVSAIFMLWSVLEMKKQNEQMTKQIKISADSVEEMKKQNEQMRQQYKDEKEERVRESIQKFIDTYLTIPTLDELEKYPKKEKTYFFDNIQDPLTLLKMKVSRTKYSYLSDYIQEIKSYIETIYEGNKYLIHYITFLQVSIQEITKYMYIGEEDFNKVWKEDIERMKDSFNNGIEDYIKRNETKNP